MIYLDHNATTPPHASVLDAMRAAAEQAWANPASVHRPGQRARAFLEQARGELGVLLGLPAREVVLTSGGTEANNLALWHAFAGGRAPGALVTSRLEHPSIVRAAEDLARRGIEVRWATPTEAGQIDAAAIERALAGIDRVALVTLQAVNHETGVLQPVAEVAALAHARGARLVVDAVQAAGRIDPDCWRGGDLVTVASHKMRGPKGIGALAVAPGIKLRPLLLGGEQERGVRPGTQDAALAAGFAVAARRAREGGPGRYARLAGLRDGLEAGLVSLGGELGYEVRVNGTAPRAPHVSNLSFAGWEGAALAAALDLEGVAVSSGSACSAGTARPSPVIAAMLGRERARSAVRISLGEDTTEAEVDMALSAFVRVLRRGSLNA
jgi:cysteine desulfurase